MRAIDAKHFDPRTAQILYCLQIEFHSDVRVFTFMHFHQARFDVTK